MTDCSLGRVTFPLRVGPGTRRRKAVGEGGGGDRARQRSERLFAGLCHLEGLCCVRRARAEALAALGRSLQRNHAARAFVEAREAPGPPGLFPF